MACRDLAEAMQKTFGEPRPLTTPGDVQQLTTELEELELRLASWSSKPIWQGSELSVLEVELGVLANGLKEFPDSDPTLEGHHGRKIGESVKRLKTIAERLRTFCSAP